ncbi:MAG TPA: cytochrome C [Gammaproteobacteria bacterium]|nr:cytochrome C [Gammaproteobacteria bacterium]
MVSLFVLTGCGQSDYRPESTASGEQMFAQACSGCHGEGGQGRFGFLLTIAGTEHPADKVATKILEGGLIMPEFVQLTEEQRLEIANYLKP